MTPKEQAKQRRIPQLIVHLHDTMHMTFGEISSEVERRLALEEGRKPLPARGNRPWKRDRCCRAYHKEKEAQTAEAKLQSSVELDGLDVVEM